jgi:hypothetical protein
MEINDTSMKLENFFLTTNYIPLANPGLDISRSHILSTGNIYITVFALLPTATHARKYAFCASNRRENLDAFMVYVELRSAEAYELYCT